MQSTSRKIRPLVKLSPRFEQGRNPDQKIIVWCFFPLQQNNYFLIAAQCVDGCSLHPWIAMIIRDTTTDSRVLQRTLAAGKQVASCGLPCLHAFLLWSKRCLNKTMLRGISKLNDENNALTLTGDVSTCPWLHIKAMNKEKIYRSG